ncbi:putative amidohydrolase [Plectosphaerella plurivora]|uniref:Peptidase M20 domain-containing protein 2 n=1 Tax=Plectosphaerella plurivora TaxID=936078 RepID=A0A9P9AC80_9PEZI|nr:putative amidohydrolase [Plectosphaerella plurivora]
MQLRDGALSVPDIGHEPPAIEAPNFLPDIASCIDSLTPSLWPLNSFIHNHPELGFQEHQAHDALTAFVRSHPGWKVTPSAYGMATAWEAVYDTGRPGPAVAFNAEMDALPNLGHACGHNLIAVTSVAAALTTAHVLRAHNLPGRVILLGTPAEEGGGGGKIKCLEADAYKDVDATIISHPGILNNSPMVRTTAYARLEATYHGRAAHAANAPWMGINALDALVIAYNAISALRQQTRPDDVIGLQITDGGNKPNVIHERAAGVAVLRAATASRLAELQRKVEACFRAGADAAGATVDIRVVPGYKDHVPNRVLAASYKRYWEALPGHVEPALPPEGVFTHVKASTDQGDLSYALPSVNVSFAIPPGEGRGQPHSPDFEKASATRAAFDRAMRVATGMAGMAVDLCATPGLLEEVQQQWRRDMKEFGAQGA